MSKSPTSNRDHGCCLNHRQPTSHAKQQFQKTIHNAHPLIGAERRRSCSCNSSSSSRGSIKIHTFLVHLGRPAAPASKWKNVAMPQLVGRIYFFHLEPLLPQLKFFPPTKHRVENFHVQRISRQSVLLLLLLASTDRHSNERPPSTV